MMDSKETPITNVCRFCGLPAYKTDSHGLICYNLAMYGDCHATGAKGSTPRHVVRKAGRNEPCTCGSGKKFKNCCLNKTT